MPKFPEDVKALLQEAGRWTEFTKIRKAMTIEGVDALVANNDALAEIYGDEERPQIVFTDGRRFLGFSAIIPEGGAPCPKRDIKTVGQKKAVPKKKAVAKKPSHPTAKKSDFEDKTCSEADAVRWVGANMEVSDVNPEDAPSSTAWGMLVYYQSNTLYKGEFWKMIYPKLLPTRANIGDEGEGAVIDGKPTIDLLDRIASIGESPS